MKYQLLTVIGLFILNGVQAGPSGGDVLFARLHALCMFLAWGVCASLGIFISRFGKNKLGIWWFRFHVGLGVSVLVLNILGFISIFGYLDWELQFDDTHHQIGFMAIGGLIIQVCLGFAADRLYDAQRKEVPFWPDQVHWYLGLTIWIAAVINIILGLNMEPYWWNKWYFAFYWFGIAFLAAVFGFTKRVKEKTLKDQLLLQ